MPLYDPQQLDDQRAPKKVIPKTVPGRVVHIDADFLAYMVAYDDNKPVLEMQAQCREQIEKMRLLSGAETYALHLTPRESTKGNRGNIAIQKEYQGNRKGKMKPKHLHMIRNYMADELKGIMCLNYEADDSMCMAAYNAVQQGNPDLAVIATKDKDLTMIPGLQLNWDTGELQNTETDWGFIELIEKGNGKVKTKKVVGRGYKYFFAQLLMGDTADNIQGIPKVVHPDYTDGKLKSCGPVLTYNLINPMTSVKEAFELTKTLFKSTGELLPYKHWESGEAVPWNKVMISEMKLLWMRRKDDENDVLHWLKENV